jgi:SET domain-containing protein
MHLSSQSAALHHRLIYTSDFRHIQPNCIATEYGSYAISICALREISKNEELTIDYAIRQPETPEECVRCDCKAPTCRHWLNLLEADQSEDDGADAKQEGELEKSYTEPAV